MTLGEAKDKVYMLMDEYSTGGSMEKDADLEKKMAPFFDTAQKQLAQQARIIRTHTPERVAGVTEYAMPADFGQLYRVWEDGQLSRRVWRFFGQKLVVPAESGVVALEYFAVPTTINADTPDNYAFEVIEAAAQTLPFFVAAQQLVADMEVDYAALLNLWQIAVNALDTRLPEQAARVRQSYYGG